MSFTTKKYTRPVLLAEVQKLNATSFVSYNEFVNSFSPRAGARSAKLSALKSLVGANNLRTLLTYTKNKNAKRSLLFLVKNA